VPIVSVSARRTAKIATTNATAWRSLERVDRCCTPSPLISTGPADRLERRRRPFAWRYGRSPNAHRRQRRRPVGAGLTIVGGPSANRHRAEDEERDATNKNGRQDERARDIAGSDMHRSRLPCDQVNRPDAPFRTDRTMLPDSAATRTPTVQLVVNVSRRRRTSPGNEETAVAPQHDGGLWATNPLTRSAADRSRSSRSATARFVRCPQAQDGGCSAKSGCLGCQHRREEDQDQDQREADRERCSDGEDEEAARVSLHGRETPKPHDVLRPREDDFRVTADIADARRRLDNIERVFYRQRP
jgi:hypothetical protein